MEESSVLDRVTFESVLADECPAWQSILAQAGADR
jgi:hypothetical protein